MDKTIIKTTVTTVLILAAAITFSVLFEYWIIVFLIAAMLIAAVIYILVQEQKGSERRKKFKESMEKCDPRILLDWAEAHKNDKDYPPKEYFYDCGSCCTLLGESEKGKEYYEMYGGMELDNYERFLYYNGKAAFCFDDGDFEKGEELISAANEYAAKVTLGVYRKSIDDLNICLRYSMEIKRGNCCDEVEKYFLDKLEKTDCLSMKCINSGVLAEFYFNRGDYEKVKKYCEFVIANGNRLYCVKEAKALAEKAGIVPGI